MKHARLMGMGIAAVGSLLLLAPHSAQSGSINSLLGTYGGTLHGIQTPGDENSSDLTFLVTQKSANGHFSGVFQGTTSPISGTVEANGKVTLKAHLTGPGLDLVLKGTGFLTALGSHLSAHVTLTGALGQGHLNKEPFIIDFLGH